MIFHETELAGVFEIHLEPSPDERGFFARSWCQKEFERYHLNPRVVQCNVSFNYRKIYVPEECAHGFLTLADETEVFYQMSEFYHPELARGVRWDDPTFGVS